MRLTQLQYLLEIKKQGSISKAAQHLYIAQPSMSTAIHELEEELGYELMKRSKKGVTFTNLGEQAVEKAAVIMQEVESLRCLDEINTGHMMGRLFLSAVPFVSEHFVLDLMIALAAECPDLHLILDENDGGIVLQQVNRWEADLGIIMICSNEEKRFQREIKKNALCFKELYQDEICFLVGRANPNFNEKTVSMTEILRYPYVYYKESFTEEDRMLFSKYCDLSTLNTICMKDRESIKKYVVHSQATTILPAQVAQDNVYIRSGLLHALRLSDESWTCRVGIVYRKDMPLTREALFLLNRMQKMFNI